MSFGSRNSRQRNPAMTGGQNPGQLPLPANVPQSANASVLIAGLMGMRPKNAPALSNNFGTGGPGAGLGRRPGLAKRTMVGGL